MSFSGCLGVLLLASQQKVAVMSLHQQATAASHNIVLYCGTCLTPQRCLRGVLPGIICPDFVVRVTLLAIRPSVLLI